MISSVATMTTHSCMKDIIRLLISISIYSPNVKIYILCDTTVKDKISLDFPFLNIIYQCTLDKYSNKTRQTLEAEGKWLEFMLEKCSIIDYALQFEDHVLFLDADIILFNSIESILEQIPLDYDVGLSRHEIIAQDEQLYGKYNGGFIYVRNKSLTNWWRKESLKSSFFEQKAMDNIPIAFKTFFFLPQNNFGWWRLCQTVNPQEVANKFTVQNDIIHYDSKPLNSIHTHLDGTFPYTVIFNNFIRKLITHTNNSNYQKLIVDL